MAISEDYRGCSLEPIAIIGMGCRFADNASSPSKLWDMLTKGRSGQSDFPKNRVAMDSWYHPTKMRPGSMNGRGGYFLSHDDSYRNFDPSFFKISPLEAMFMDPQQRKMLEVVYECFESAGKSLEDMSGSETACYVGSFKDEHSDNLWSHDTGLIIPYHSTGTGLTILSNRVNYAFNLKGPSMTVDTACSSSLYALHLACQSIMSGDCISAIVGGASIIQSIEKHIGASWMGILSPTSTCHTFDASADGFGRGDGVAAIMIKPLSNAIADGDPIRAVIRATAVNSNGTGIGISHPGAEAQEAAIRKAYARAGLDFSKTGYFETHGTGTPVGDPIECIAIGKVFAESRTPSEPLLIGSVKTNLGHCEGASGLAGIIKAVLCLQEAQIPPTIGIQNLNPNIDFQEGRLSVVRSLTPWPAHLPYRRASVNGFGYGGSNAHIILDAAECYLESYPGESCKRIKSLSTHQATRKYILPFSAHDAGTLEHNIKAVLQFAADRNDNISIADVASTLSKRSKLRCRGFGIRADDEPVEGLVETAITLGALKPEIPTIAYVFTGQGAQWIQMGYKLISQFPIVLQTFRQLDNSLQALPNPPDFTITDVLSATDDSIYHAIRSPVCCTAIQVALVLLLDSWGISPRATVGHSAGEIGAAFAAGLLTGAEAVAIAYYRGLAVLNCKEKGAMLAVGLGATLVAPFIKAHSDVVIGCYNSPHSVTLSGGVKGIDETYKRLREAGIFVRMVNTSGNAYHSPLMRSASIEFENLFKTMYYSMIKSTTREEMLPHRPMYSAITGEKMELAEISFEHWQRNLESPTLFDQACQLLIHSEHTVNTLVELGPHSALSGPVKQILTTLGFDQTNRTYIPTLIRSQDGANNMLHFAGTLFVAGYPIDIDKVNFPVDIGTEEHKTGNFVVDLPTYQWQYESGILWKESRRSQENRFRTQGTHDILGVLVPGGSRNSFLFRNYLSVDHVPWLRDHKIGDDIIFPAAGYIAQAVEALQQVSGDIENSVGFMNGYRIQGLRIGSALLIPDDDTIETLLNMRILRIAGDATWYDFTISSVTATGNWSEHATGNIVLVDKVKINPQKNLQNATGKNNNAKSWYSALAQAGVHFGPAFQTLSDINLKNQTAVARVSLNTTEEIMANQSRYVIHPTTLDGCLQLSVMAAHGSSKSSSKAFLPVSVDDFTIWESPTSEPLVDEAIIHARGEVHGLRSVRGSATVFDTDGQIMLEGNVWFLSLEGGLTQSQSWSRKPYSRLVWKPDVDRLTREDIGNSSREIVPALDISLEDYMELLTHKGRQLDILHIGCTSIQEGITRLERYSSRVVCRRIAFASPSQSLLDDLRAETALAKVEVRQLDICKIEENQVAEYGLYDLVVLEQFNASAEMSVAALTNCKRLLKSDGRLVLCPGIRALISRSKFPDHLAKASLSSCFTHSEGIMICEPQLSKNKSTDTIILEAIWLVYLHTPHKLCTALRAIAENANILFRQIPLLEAGTAIAHGANVIFAIELESPVFAQLSQVNLEALKVLLKNTSTGIWVTNSGLLDGANPAKSLTSGLAKTLMTEQPSLQMSCFDIDPSEENLARSADHILDQYFRLKKDDASNVELNLVEKNGLVHISRFVPDERQNEEFERILNAPIEKGNFDKGLELDFQQVGKVGSFYCKRSVDCSNARSLGSKEVLLYSHMYSLTSQESSILKGHEDSTSFSHEVVCIVSEIGSQVSDLRVGDRVVCLHAGKFDSSIIVDREDCHALRPHEKADEVCGTIIPLCTALYALDQLGRHRPGDRVLIHFPGNILLTTALIQIAKNRELKLIVIYAEEHEKEYYLKFLSSENLIAATSLFPGHHLKGTDYNIRTIVTSANNDDPHDLWRLLQRNGQYICLGRAQDYPDVGTFQKKAATFRFLDFFDTLRNDPEDIRELLKEALRIYRQEIFQDRRTVLVFDISELESAVQKVTSISESEKVLISCSSHSIVPVSVLHQPHAFNPSAVFIMIGCLGGLGRSITQWMLHRGARLFVYLARSGNSSKDAMLHSAQVKEFSQQNNVEVMHEIIQGSVVLRKDVDTAIAAARRLGNIKGVIQAAAVFKEDLFENLTVESFNMVTDPKVQGTINLHEALINEPLDFFVMTSSTLGLKAPATQSAYAAGNAFLDAMARHRWSLGLQAFSLSLGMILEVGHIEDNPEIEEQLLKTGLYGINEEEFLVMMEQAVQLRDFRNPPEPTSKWDMYSDAHIVTGLEPRRLGAAAHALFGRDERFRCFPENSNLTAALPISNSDTASLLANALAAGGKAAMKEAVTAIILAKFSKSVLVPVEKLEAGLDRPLTDFGMDSMVSSELRAVAWREFGADVPFMKVLEKGFKLGQFVELVWEKVMQGRGKMS